MPPLIVLPPSLAADESIFNAVMNTISAREASSRVAQAVYGFAERDANIRAKRSKHKLDVDQNLADALEILSRALLFRLVRCGLRSPARKLAMNIKWSQFDGGAPGEPVAHFASAAEKLPVMAGQVVILFLAASDTDAQWDAQLREVLQAAHEGSASALLVHSAGHNDYGDAVTRLNDAMARVVQSSEAAATAQSIATAYDAGDVLLDAALAQLAQLPGDAARVTERSMRTKAALSRLMSVPDIVARSGDAAAAQRQLDAAIALLPDSAGWPGDVRAAFAAAESALSHTGIQAALREAADMDAAAAPPDAWRAALPRWRESLTDAERTSLPSDSVAGQLAEVLDDAVAVLSLCERLPAACSAPAAFSELPSALAALRALLDEASSFQPLAAASLLASARTDAVRTVARWDALLQLSAASAATFCDASLVAAALRASLGAADALSDATVDALAEAIAARLVPSLAAASSAGYAPAQLSMVEAGPRIQYNKADALGRGSAGTVVYAGVFISERGKRLPAAVKCVPLPSGGEEASEAARKQRAAAERELEYTRELLKCSTRVCTPYGQHSDGEYIYSASELCACSLTQLLDAAARASKRLPLKLRLGLLQDFFAALAEWQQHNFAHNDLHAGNVMLVRAPGAPGAALRGIVKLTDLQRVARANKRTGTLQLETFVDAHAALNLSGRAPEVQRNAPMSLKTDIWSAGVIAYQVLFSGAARSPFAAPPRAGGVRQRPGVVGLGGPSSLDELEENRRILEGRLDLSALSAAKLPPRTALECAHLLGVCLAVEPEARPTAAELCAHPLFWQPVEVADKLWELNDALKAERGATEERLLQACAALDAQALQQLTSWRAEPRNAALLAAMRATDFQRSAYERDGLRELVRFLRNALEHPPMRQRGVLGSLASNRKGALAEGGELGVAEWRYAIAAHACNVWPALPLAAHLGLQALRPGREPMRTTG
jgi:serine/threonine protein kinase